MLLETLDTGAITLSQTQYAADLKKIVTEDHLELNKIKCQKALRTPLRQALGSLIWLHQPRPAIGFDITKLATGAVAACTDPTLERAAINL